MKLAWGAEDIAVPAAMKLLGFDRDFGNCVTATVLTENDALAAIIVFHNYCPDAAVIEISAAAVTPRWAQRSVLREAFGYAFANCQMVVSRTSAENATVRKLWKAFGADEVVIPRLRGRDEAECIITLTDDAWAASKFAR
ncbi:hypothetical protein [Sulfitobacter sp. 1A12157]|uniref:hypothetical protein n=1 Tax=Sulfitobacter sp. 1A12157 TaxID=3368594 RepID=UPI0037453C6F